MSAASESITLTLYSEADTERLGAILAAHLPASCVVALNGTLGAGKTRLVRAVAAACEVPATEVTSPTFTLWQTYQGVRAIHHLDAYRIRDEDEFDALGVYESFDEQAVTFVEWADRVQGSLPIQDLLRIDMEVLGEAEREVTVSGGAVEFRGLWEGLKSW